MLPHQALPLRLPDPQFSAGHSRLARSRQFPDPIPYRAIVDRSSASGNHRCRPGDHHAAAKRESGEGKVMVGCAKNGEKPPGYIGEGGARAKPSASIHAPIASRHRASFFFLLSRLSSTSNRPIHVSSCTSSSVRSFPAVRKDSNIFFAGEEQSTSTKGVPH